MHQAAWHLWENIYCETSKRKISFSKILCLLHSKHFKICPTRIFGYFKLQGLGWSTNTQGVNIKAGMFATGYLRPCWLLIFHHKLKYKGISSVTGQVICLRMLYIIVRYIYMYIEENPSQMHLVCEMASCTTEKCRKTGGTLQSRSAKMIRVLKFMACL